MRGALTPFFRALLRLFFRRVEVRGLERLPADGPAIVALNHPNGLVDPLFILCLSPRPVSFLAKEPLFRMPVVGAFARAFDCIPVYRRQDEADPAKNRETFERARALLAKGGVLALFPEGTTHSDPRLRPLKTGAARIALGAASAPGGAPGGAPLALVPAGLTFTAKTTFRSAALLSFGEPLAVEPVLLDENGEPPREAVAELTSSLAAALDAVTLQADEAEALALVSRAERIFSAAERDESARPGGGAAGASDGSSLSDRFELQKRFLAAYAALRERRPRALAAIAARVSRYDAALAEAGLEAGVASPSRLRLGAVAKATARTAALAALLGPLALLGLAVHYPAYRLVGFLATSYGRSDDSVLATAKLLSGMLLFPFTWLGLAAVAARAAGLAAGAAALVLAPAAGLAALVFAERIDGFLVGARALSLLLFSKRRFLRLAAERRRIRSAIRKLASEL